MKRLALLLLLCLLAGCPRPGGQTAAGDPSITPSPVSARLVERAGLPSKADGAPVEVRAVLGRADSRKDLGEWHAVALLVLDLRARQGDAALLATAWEFMDLMAGAETPGKRFINEAFPDKAGKLRYLVVVEECLREPPSGEGGEAAEGRAGAMAAIRSFCLASMASGRNTEAKITQMAAVSLTMAREERAAKAVEITPVPVAPAGTDAADLTVTPEADESRGARPWTWGDW